MADKILTAERLRELLHYDPETGVFSRRSGPRAGLPVGSRHSAGYLAINVDRQPRLAHRLAWLYMTGKWPEINLDHINLIKTDNRFANLREAGHSENNQNCEARSGNKVGLRGVTYTEACKTNPWRAQAQVRGVLTYEYHPTLLDAAAASFRLRRELMPFSKEARA